jgi:DNA-binding beta-propeller fold protein YncE
MKLGRSAGIALGALCMTAALWQMAARAQEKGGENETGPYEVVTGWPKPLGHPGWTWGSQGGVFAENPNRIILLQRGELPVPEKAPEGYTGGYGAFGVPATQGKPRLEHCILIVDADGTLIEDWTQWDHLFAGGRGPHKVRISPYDPEKHVWIVDDEVDQIFKFTHDGKQLVLTLGEHGVRGTDDKHFARPTDIAWLPDGTFFITDGYVNTRVVKFDKDGKYLMTWGTKGSAPGQFNLPHSIAIDAKRRLYVADRSNSRIQIFDENGK